MKKNRILKLGLLALALTLVTASLVSGTLAKYVTTFTGTGTVTVAQWHPDFQGTTASGTTTTSSTTFDVVGTRDPLDETTVVEQRVAPGTGGTFDLKFDLIDTEVAANIVIKILPGATVPVTDLEQLTIKDRNGNFVSVTDAGVVVSDADYLLGSDAHTAEQTISVEWKWIFDGDNGFDTAEGISNKTYNLVAEMVATQLD